MKIFCLLIFSFVLLSANNYALKLYEKLLLPLFHDVPIVIFADKESKEILQKSDMFEVKSSCSTLVDVLVGSQFTNLSQNCISKPLFATTYRSYSENNNAFGAFYWRKGRPQIHFKKAILKKFHLKLSKNLQRFIDE